MTSSSLPLLVLLLCFCLLDISNVHCLNNGLARTPPMGFNTWNQFACKINETLVKQTIDSMVSSGLRDIGYKFVNIDDCWALPERDAITKRMVPDPVRFPNGILHLAQYAHAKGMYLGIYSDLGSKTCAGYPGSAGFYELDAQTFADWEIDYLKFDFCSTTEEQRNQPWIDYSIMSQALNKTGRPMVYSLCNWGVQKPWQWGSKIANLWRTTGDIEPKWTSVMDILDKNKELYPFSEPGGWNDPDMLEVGVERSTSLSQSESRVHFSLWAMINAPLLLGNDLRDLKSIEPWVLDIIANRDVIEVNQDPLGLQGYMMEEHVKGVNATTGECLNIPNRSCVRTEVWVKPLSNKGFAVVLFNRGGNGETDSHFTSEVMTVSWAKHLRVNPKIKYYIKDLWKNKYMGVYSESYIAEQMIPPHDLVMLRLHPLE